MIKYVCWRTQFSQQATNTAFIGYKATSTNSTSALPSSSNTSSSRDITVGIGVLVGLLVFIIIAIGFLWWCCFARRNSWWKNRRKKKYLPIPESSNTNTSAPGPQSSATPSDRYSNTGYGAQGESCASSGIPSRVSNSEGYTNAGFTFQTPPAGNYANASIAPQRPSSAIYAQIGIPPHMRAHGGYKISGIPMAPIKHLPSASPPLEQPPSQTLTERPSGVLEWKPSESGTRTWTYRVEFIPNHIPREKMKELFSLFDSKMVKIRSLAPSIATLGHGTKTATVEHTALFKNSNGPSLSSEAEKDMHVSIDRSFMGWTPLNNPSPTVHAE